jgi:opacity protein-like surface antigen
MPEKGELIMKRFLAIPCLFLLTAVLIAPPTAGAQGFAVKLFGGYNYMNGGDVKDGQKGILDYYTEFFPLLGYTAHQEYKPLRDAWDVGGDIIFYFTPNIGIGLGAGYIQSFTGASTLALTRPLTTTIDFTSTPKVSAIPIRASLYVAIPLGTGASLTLHGGAAYYLAKMQYVLKAAAGTDWEQVEIKADGKGIGFHAGIGLEVDLSSNLSFVVEGTGRLANIDGFTGTNMMTSSGGGSVSESGTLYFYKYNYGVLGTFSEIDLRDTVPSGPAYSDIREAKVDFSGFSARTGLILRF